jgi:hypothetical protein
LNQLIGNWGKAKRLKTLDRDLVWFFARAGRVPPAAGKRRVDLEITLGKGQRRVDPDALWKSTLDALVKADLLIDDDERSCLPGVVDQSRRAVHPSTTIVLTDLEGG